MGVWGRDWVCEVLSDALQVYIGVPGPESGLFGPKTAKHLRFQIFVPTGETPLIQLSETHWWNMCWQNRWCGGGGGVRYTSRKSGELYEGGFARLDKNVKQ